MECQPGGNASAVPYVDNNKQTFSSLTATTTDFLFNSVLSYLLCSASLAILAISNRSGCHFRLTVEAQCPLEGSYIARIHNRYMTKYRWKENTRQIHKMCNSWIRSLSNIEHSGHINSVQVTQYNIHLWSPAPI
ncbi:uncharacterized protein ARMOST_17959 [Armillaria ostoyae]|uniref:Uncharacterized protein n=1 Tax=Armillaria ostoyae TaxID=47428 RepID=A0A284S0F0_ARMOS|nr:uncharacterized protein ARMOST_17959 [Armillaria ostoyae]